MQGSKNTTRAGTKQVRRGGGEKMVVEWKGTMRESGEHAVFCPQCVVQLHGVLLREQHMRDTNGLMIGGTITRHRSPRVGRGAQRVSAWGISNLARQRARVGHNPVCNDAASNYSLHVGHIRCSQVST